MNRTAIFVLTGLLATTVGFALGFRSAREEVTQIQAASAPPVEVKVASTSSVEVGKSVGDFRDDVEELLTSLASGGEDELISELQRTEGDFAMAPQFARFSRETLIGKLVELGAAERALGAAGANPRERDEVLRVVVRKLAEKNPAAAEELTFRLPVGKERQMALSELLGTLGTNDPERGMELLRAHPEARTEDSSLFRAWAKEEPRAATEAAITLRKELGGFGVSSALYSWSETDPPAAWQWIKHLPSEDQQWALGTYVNALVNKDPLAALDTMLKTPELADATFASWIGSNLAVDPASADALLDRVPPGRLRTKLASGAASGLMRQDPALALAWADTLLPGERESVVTGIFSQLGMNDPELGIRLASEHLEGPAAEAAIARTVQGWARTYPEPALKALVQYLDNDALKRALPGVMSPTYMVVGQDFRQRMKFVAELDPEVRPVALRATGVQWGAMDPYAVRDHLAGLDPEDRVLLVEGLVSGIDESAPQLVAEYARWLPPQKQLANAREIARSIAESDPQAAANFLKELPADSKESQGAMQSLVRDWVYQDATQASAFASSLPAGARKDAVSLTLARELKNFDLDGATRMLAGVTTPSTRATLVRELASTWSQVDAQRGQAVLTPLLTSEEDRGNAAELMKKR